MRTSICLLIVLALGARPAAAQEPPRSDAATALARVPPGSTVRIQTVPGAVLEGALWLGRDSVVLDLDGARRAVAFGDVRSAWYRQRQTRRVATAGALLGGAAGGAYLGFMVLVFGSTSDEAVSLVGIGLLGGAAAGGLLGAVVGSAVPRWTLVYPADPEVRPRLPQPTERPVVPGEAEPGRRRLGAVEGALGYGRVGGDEPTGGGPGARVGLHAEFGADPAPGRTAAFVSIGPELGAFGLGTTDRLRRSYVPGDTIELTRRYHAFTAGGVLRAGLDAGSWRGYGLAGLAYNRWAIEDRDVVWISQGLGRERPAPSSGSGTFEHVGYSAGAGAQAAVAQRAALGIELRHTAVGTFDMDLPAGYWTLTLTAARRW